MADYTSQYSGPQIDEAIRRALSFSPEEIGMKKILTTKTTAQDLNQLYVTGYYTMDFFSNGPVNLGDISPIQLQITKSTDESGSETLVQTIPTTTGYAFRTSTDGGSNWSDWTVSTDPAFLLTEGALEDTVCKAYTITSAAAVVTNNAEFRVRLHAPNGQGATFSINGSQPYKAVNSMGQEMQLGDNEAGAFVIMYFAGEPWNLDNSNAETVGCFHLIGAPTLGTKERALIEEYNSRMQGGEGADQKGKNSRWWDIDVEAEDMVTERVLVARDFSEQSATPRRIVASKLTLDEANAVADLGQSMVVITDETGKPTTNGSLETKVVTSIIEMRNEGNHDKLLAVKESGEVYATGASAASVQQLGTLTASRALVSDAEGKVVPNSTTAAKITAVGALGASKGVVTDASGNLVDSVATSAKIDAIGNLANSKMVGTDASGKLVSIEFPQPHMAEIVYADSTTGYASTDLPTLSAT